MALSKKLRFEVFKRDGFTCQYCGGHPPAIVLEADHIQPKSKGGKDDINNLITSCFTCNRGKAAVTLNQVPPTLAQNVNILKEKEEQYRAYMKLVRNVDKRVNEEIDEVQQVYLSVFKGYYFSDSFRSSVKKFINSLGLIEVKDSMAAAVGKVHDPGNSLRYFCGICWSKIRGNG